MTTVIDRHGKVHDVDFNKILTRLKGLLSDEELKKVNIVEIAKKTIESIYPNITTQELDLTSANVCAEFVSSNPLYGSLGGRILASNLRKSLDVTGLKSFSQRTEYIASNVKDYLKSDFLQYIQKNATKLDKIIVKTRDYDIDYFGFKTLERAYLIKVNGKIAETPQDLFMRVAVNIHYRTNFGKMEVIENIKNTYDLMSQKYFIHATPTLFNSGTTFEQQSSCFLLGTEDSLNGIFKTITDAAQISKWAGGIGIHISNIRAAGSKINSTNGNSTGVVPMCKVYNDVARYINQGGRRPGSIALYLEPWHADVMEFLELKLNTGAEELRARDLFLAMWIPDIFMRCVQEDGDWYLMTPDVSPRLNEVYGEEFEKLYNQYIEEGKFVRKVKASKIWERIMVSQIETGVPYICFKDNVNRASNQINVGIVKSSNLCVAPETKILTSNGYVTICDMVNQEVDVWNGKEFSTVKVIKTGDNQKLIKISFSNGETLECTPYHKFYITENDTEIVKTAVELQVNDKIIPFIINDKEYNITVIQIEDSGRMDDTYCFKEPMEHKGVFNGILTGQCAEIVEVSTNDSYAVCNLASICVNRFLSDDGIYDWDLLHKVARTATFNLNQIIDYNFYPTKETKENNLSNRPIGIGIQGLADLFCKMKIPFESKEAIELDADIMETIYHGAIEMSIELAEKHGSYPSFKGSPFSNGLFQFDHWKVTPRKYDWSELRQKVKKGIRNSMLTALMPTATTSQIQGNTECFEPVTNNIYTRKTLAGNFMVVNNYLIDDLKALNLWDLDMKNDIINCRGSIQTIERIPQNVKDVYKTAWEIKQKVVIDHAIARSPYVDQSQSMNLFMSTPTYDKVTSALFYGWKNGLKTGCYYLRSQPVAAPQQFSQDVKKLVKKEETLFCSLANPEACAMCSS